MDCLIHDKHISLSTCSCVSVYAFVRERETWKDISLCFCLSEPLRKLFFLTMVFRNINHVNYFLVKLKCKRTSIRVSNGRIRTLVWFPPSWWKVRSSTLLCPKLHRQNHSGVRNIHYISGIHFAAIYGLPQRTFRAKKCREALHDLHMPSDLQVWTNVVCNWRLQRWVISSHLQVEKNF